MCFPNRCPAMDISVCIRCSGKVCWERLWLAMDLRSGSIIPTFRRHVTIWVSWLRIGSNGGLLWTRPWIFGSVMALPSDENSLVKEDPVPQCWPVSVITLSPVTNLQSRLQRSDGVERLFEGRTLCTQTTLRRLTIACAASRRTDRQIHWLFVTPNIVRIIFF
jgi:hypothetical protein